MRKNIIKILFCLVLLSNIININKVNAAGTAKPSGVQKEASYEVLGVNGHQHSGNSINDCGLFDGTQVNEWNTSNVMYWSDYSTYVELNINEPCNIWRSGTTTWSRYYKPLKILKWDGTNYNDITSTINQSLSPITETSWEKTISNLPAGRYKFAYKENYRLDSEWYIESVDSITPVSNLTATSGDKQITLNWSNTNGNTFNIKRSTTLGGPYTTISSTSSNTYTDISVTNGTTYYYVVSIDDITYSNEAYATPNAPITGNNAILEITMTNGNIKVFDLTSTEIVDFLTWYDNRSEGLGKAYYIFKYKTSTSPYISKKVYIAFNKISSFDINEYN